MNRIQAWKALAVNRPRQSRQRSSAGDFDKHLMIIIFRDDSRYDFSPSPDFSDTSAITRCERISFSWTLKRTAWM
ncbi:hypothetical protein, partial [Luteolibacter marinus]|uniref:hypothetical protein n=1 Tax=Luteolibacter marinus TaxID=2776705 RepID=UPI001D029B4F